MRLYEITPNECNTVRVEANSEEEAREIAFRDFNKLFKAQEVFLAWEVWDDPRNYNRDAKDDF